MFQAKIEFPGLPISKGFSGNFEGNLAPPPSNAETLRHIADGVSGDEPMNAIFAGILRRAADELSRWEWLVEHHNDIDAPILVCYDSETHASLEDAIDASRKAGYRRAAEAG